MEEPTKKPDEGGDEKLPVAPVNAGVASLGTTDSDLISSPPISPINDGDAEEKKSFEDPVNQSFESIEGNIGKVDGKPPLSPLNPVKRKVSKGHNRMVSWGIMGGPPSLRKLGSNGTEDLDSGTKVSIQSVMNTNPYESEAEAYIQQHLDEIDPTTVGTSEAQKTILGAVPQDATSEAFDFRRKSMMSMHRRTKTRAENLFSLAMDFGDLHKDSTRNASIKEGGDIGAYIDEGVTSADKLARHGAVLLNRRRLESAASVRMQSLEEASQESLDDQRSDIAAGESDAAAKKSDATGPDLEAQRGDQSTKNHNTASSTGGSDIHSRHKKQRKTNFLKRTNNRVIANYKDFEDWLVHAKGGYREYIKVGLFYFIIPLTGAAAVCYYIAGNPPCGTTSQCVSKLEQNRFYSIDADSVVERFPILGTAANVASNVTASGNSTSARNQPKVSVDELRGLLETAAISWWLLFVVRQIITFSLAHLIQAILVEYLALRSKVCVVMFGPFVTLFLVQSKGWPLLMFLWALLDFLLLYGKTRLAAHWLFFQDYIGLFSESNPSGTFTSSTFNKRILILAMGVAMAVAVKRFWLGIFLGRQTFDRYADELAKAMQKALLIGKVAALGRNIEQQTGSKKTVNLDASRYVEMDETMTKDGAAPDDVTIKSTHQDVLDGLRMSSEQKVRIEELLGAWEEPDVGYKQDEKASIGAIIQFRNSLSYLNTSYPFGAAFGVAGTRKECIASVEAVYQRLLLGYPGDVLHFDIIASLAVKANGSMDEQLLKSLIKIFRPDRDGLMPLLPFAKAVDTSYKELRLLRASVASSSRMDRAFEGILNVGFYFVLVCFVLYFLDVDPFVLFASISGFVLGFAFMIGAACSKYFEGLLFILIRQPYGVGDRIAVSDVNSKAPGEGSPGWIVKDVDLFTTTVVYASTNEVATYSNGALASSRIINMARSPKALLHFLFKFPIDTQYARIKIFHGAIENFVKARPREYARLLAFRTTRVEVDLGFVEYIVYVEHRESWQQTAALLTSKAELSSFALELMKKMNIKYRAPPMPIDLSMTRAADSSVGNVADLASELAPRTRLNSVDPDGNNSVGIESVEALFKH